MNLLKNNETKMRKYNVKKEKKTLIISQAILAVSVLIAVIILLRPGSQFDIQKDWFIFILLIIYPVISSIIAIVTTKGKDKDDN